MEKISIDLNKLKRQSVDIDREENPPEEENTETDASFDDILQEELLQEGEIEQFGAQIQLLLQRMFGMNSLPVEVTGNSNDVKVFANLMGREKSYIDKIKDYGLNDPKVVSDKYKLKQAIHKFERDTGIKYPFKTR